MLPSATDLTWFYEMAMELNISRAAKKLNVSQPSLSISIKRLETRLNTHLFIRHAKGLTLTRAGQQLFNQVQKLLAQWQEIAENIRDTADHIKGKVIIGCHSTLLPFLSPMVSELLTHHPELEIHFQHGFAPEIMNNIVEGTLDIGITTDPWPHANVVILPITETEFTFWHSVKQKTIDLYAKELLVICDLQIPPTRHLLNELYALRGKIALPRISHINQIEALATMTIASTGVGILPTAYTEYYFRDQLIKVPNAPVYQKPLCLAFLPESKMIAAVSVVLNAIKNLVHALPNNSSG